MKIFYRTAETKITQLGEYSIDDIDKPIIVEKGDRKIILSGHLYRINQTAVEGMSNSRINAELCELLAHGEEFFANAIEGVFIIVAYDRSINTGIRVYRSNIVSHDIFYSNQNNLCASTEFSDFDNEIEIDNAALTCILLEGYCPSRHSRLKSINRLGTAQHLDINNGQASCVSTPTMTTQINKAAKLDDYYRCLENSIVSRRSTTQNWVELSGGWDSTSTLGTLHKHKSKDLQAITTALILQNGTTFNKYEIDKSSDIAAYYNTPHTVVNFDFNDDSLIESFYNNANMMRSLGIFESCALWRPIMYNHIYQQANDESVCFNGLFSDSVHNFGFSQYTSMPDNDYIFREFSDKMVSYLWGPTFFSKITEGNYASDSIYNLFRKYESAPEKIFGMTSPKKERQKLYFLSLLYGDYGRKVPLSSPPVYKYLNNKGKENFDNFINEGYINQACEVVNNENYYSVSLELYKNFYLQGGEQKVGLNSSKGHNIHHVTPFLDTELMKFLEAMPESWGRGVNSHKPTKFPLKEFVANKLDFPFDIMKKHKYHAYLSENESGRNINYTHELLNNSVYTDSIFSKIKQRDIEQHFDDKHFNIPALTSLLLDKTNSTPIKKRLLIYLATMVIS